MSKGLVYASFLRAVGDNVKLGTQLLVRPVDAKTQVASLVARVLPAWLWRRLTSNACVRLGCTLSGHCGRQHGLSVDQERCQVRSPVHRKAAEQLGTAPLEHCTMEQT